MKTFFLDSHDGGQRLCVHHEAQGNIKCGQLLYVHPFAEEMNKSRRMAALQARAFAAAGYEVLQIDLLGCGDSSGDFADATWAAWIADVQRGLAWLRRNGEAGPLWLWGLRAGGLLACEVARLHPSPTNLLLVQPPTSGKAVLQQFLRLRAAAGLLDSSNKGAMSEMRAALSRGEALEIAGYVLNAELATGLESATLSPSDELRHAGRRLVWLELSTSGDPAWTPVAEQMQHRWQEAGHRVQRAILQGPTFWQTSEIEEAPALIEAGPRLLSDASMKSMGSTSA